LFIFSLTFQFISSVIAKGAGGGLGSGGIGSSRGAVSVAVLELHKNEELYILVGQQGENACIKSMGTTKEEGCGDNETLDLSKFSFKSKQHMVKNINIENGAGGGGGGSYVFLVKANKTNFYFRDNNFFKIILCS